MHISNYVLVVLEWILDMKHFPHLQIMQFTVQQLLIMLLSAQDLNNSFVFSASRLHVHLQETPFIYLVE